MRSTLRPMGALRSALALQPVVAVRGVTSHARVRVAAQHASPAQQQQQPCPAALPAPAPALAAPAPPAHAPPRPAATPRSLGWLLLVGLGSSLLLVEALSPGESCAAAAAADSDCDGLAPELRRLYDPPPPKHNGWHANWDGLQRVEVSLDPATGRALHVTRHLLFIRHGQYVVPGKGAAADVDPVLTAKGREQARLTGQRLAALGYPVARIHHSTMARAAETATLIAESFPGVPLVPSDLLREGVPAAHYPAHPTWRPSAADIAAEPARIARGFESLVQRWREVDGVQVRSEAEWHAAKAAKAAKEQAAREAQRAQAQAQQGLLSELPAGSDADLAAGGRAVAAAQAELQSSARGTIALSAEAVDGLFASTLPPLQVDRYELVVCHGNVIRYSVLRALQLPVQAWLRVAVWNCGISHLLIRPNGHVGIQTLGDTGHLSKDLITYF